MNNNLPPTRTCLCLTLLAACLVAAPLPAETLFTIEDIAGDDHGSGALIYPANEHYREGDLDLLSFSVRRAEDGTWFSIELANPVRGTEGVTLGMGAGFVPAARVARHDFYAFNVEVYIDQDGERGAGRTDTLPGRRVSIAPEFAWERAIIVTPRPQVARKLMRTWQQERSTAGPWVRDSQWFDADGGYIYSEKIRVRHNRLEFFVTAAELGGLPQQDWAYTVFITGAELMQSSNFLSNTDKNAGLMLRGARRGQPTDKFGLRFGDLQQPPIVDYLSPKPGQQERLLAAGKRRLLGIVPDGTVRPIIAAGEDTSTAAEIQAAEDRQKAHARRAREAATRRDLALAEARIRQLEQQVEGGIQGDTLPKRLAALRRVYEQGIINQQEYQRIRRRLLSDEL